jgi:hypothetical protein
MKKLVALVAVAGLVVAVAIATSALGAGTSPADAINLLVGETPAVSSDPAVVGQFTSPFSEPTIDGKTYPYPCAPHPGAPATGPLDNEPRFDCKPAGVSVNVLPNHKLMYYDGLEGTENVKFSIVAEYGFNAVNDQARQLTLHGLGATFTPTKPGNGGANPNGDPTAEYTLPAPLTVTQKYNAGALFCSDNTFLPDGRILANGGTDYYLEPGVKVGNAAYGVSELEGLKQSRIYDPTTNSWSQTGSMKYGRWYPTSLALGNGNVFTASGVTKLLKPVYTTHPLDSGTNVKQTETYDVLTGKWSANPDSASRSLPLYPRLSLLPDGHVFYNAAGQSFNPFGQSYDETSWNVAASYDPTSQKWTDLGIPGLTDLAPGGKSLDPAKALTEAGQNAQSTLRQGGIPGFGSGVTIPGFRGSTFSIQMPLTPNADGSYTKASYLTAGGVLNPPSPGSYFTTSDARITSVDTAGGKDKMSTKPTGDLPGPRWYPSGVLLPTGQVLAFNGSDRDEVVGPGVEIAKRQVQMYDPATGKWTGLASSHDPRTYHNSAALLPDGRVLVGGHAPISTLYLNDTTLPGGITAPNDGRDPSFEIYSPPYVFGPRPTITAAPTALGYGKTFKVKVQGAASAIKQVVLVRNTSVTHLVDANQRTVVLPVVSRSGSTLTLKSPPTSNVTPPGAYMLFVNAQGKSGLAPSKSRQLFVGLAQLRARKKK